MLSAGSSYFEEGSAEYGDFASMYQLAAAAAAYNGAQASLAWQFQQQMMQNMHIQQLQQQRLQQIKAERLQKEKAKKALLAMAKSPTAKAVAKASAKVPAKREGISEIGSTLLKTVNGGAVGAVGASALATSSEVGALLKAAASTQAKPYLPRACQLTA